MKTIFMWMLILTVVFLPIADTSAETTNCTETLPEIFQRVSKTVVLITAVSLNHFSMTERISTSLGSGFIIQEKGLILTNSHVVFGRQAIFVTLDDGRSVQALLVGADPILDLAALKISAADKDLPTLQLAGEVLPSVGEEVIALGNPLGLDQTLTRGVISGVNRVLPISPMSQTIPMIQTDASINPGNSGGPLVNRCGKAVGINTSAIVGAENIGFALPATIVLRVLPHLIEKGRVIRPWIGVRGKLIRKAELQQIFNIDLRDGFLVEMVEPGSPAESAGIEGGMLPVKIAGDDFLLGGDIITAANGKSVADPSDYNDFLQQLKIDDKIKLTVFREGQLKQFSLTVQERPVLPWDLPPGESFYAIPWSSQQR